VFYTDKAFHESLGQFVMGAYFVFQGFKNLYSPGMVLGRFEGYGFPTPRLFLYAGVTMMLVGGVLVAADIHAAVGAWILLVFTALATIIFQRWWTVKDPVRRPYNFLMFFYNVFILGALLLLV